MPRSDRAQSRHALSRLSIPTVAGNFTAWFSECGLAQLDFPDPRPTIPSASEPLSAPQHAWSLLTAQAVVAILDGKAPGTFPPLDFHGGTEFQIRVWSALQLIGLGETRSYAEIARQIGSPLATRAVGRACGANPIPLIIPCHRVIAGDGRLGGFSGGLGWKKRLLAVEGTSPRAGELW